jgi:hypothetical protein
MEKKDEKIILEDNNIEIVRAFEIKKQIKKLEEEFTNIENSLLEKYQDANYVNSNNIQLTIKAGSKKVIDKEYRLKEISKKEKEIEELKKNLDNEPEIKEGKKSLLFKILD